MPARRSSRLLRALAVATTALAAPAPALAADRYVAAGAPACSDDRPAAATTPSAPWCTLGPATTRTAPGDTVHVAPGTYRGTFRPLTSGTAQRPIRLVADRPGVVLDAAGAANAVKLVGVRRWVLERLTVTGGANQGVWLEGTRDVVLRAVTVTANPGTGVQLKGAAATTITGATVSANGSAGVLEHAGTTGTRLLTSRILANGRGAAPFNGDGVQLGGTGALVSGNTIVGNGGAGIHEHGIYTGSASSGWIVERNRIADSGAANVKAMGTGVVRGNRLSGGTFGLVLAANPAPVDVVQNLLTGTAQHLVLVTTGGRGRIVQTTIRQSGRRTASGEASAVFVTAAASLDVRNSLVCYDGADDLGVALWINDRASAAAFSSDANWLCSRDPRGRHVALDGHRVDPAAWRSAGLDARSAFSVPPAFDADGRPAGPSAGAGAGAGDPLPAVATDLAGAPWPAAGRRDPGALRFTARRR